MKKKHVSIFFFVTLLSLVLFGKSPQPVYSCLVSDPLVGVVENIYQNNTKLRLKNPKQFSQTKIQYSVIDNKTVRDIDSYVDIAKDYISSSDLFPDYFYKEPTIDMPYAINSNHNVLVNDVVIQDYIGCAKKYIVVFDSQGILKQLITDDDYEDFTINGNVVQINPESDLSCDSYKCSKSVSYNIAGEISQLQPGAKASFQADWISYIKLYEAYNLIGQDTSYSDPSIPFWDPGVMSSSHVAVFNFFTTGNQSNSCQYDFNNDTFVDVLDIIHLLQNWRSHGIADLIEVLRHWGSNCKKVSPICGNNVCEENEYVPCPDGAQCIWAGSCPQDCTAEVSDQQKCSQAGGSYDAVYNECEGIDQQQCTNIGGSYNGCASVCRHDPNAQVCTEQCVQVCSLKSIAERCRQQGGTYLKEYNECVNINQSECKILNGEYKSCASPCRHDSSAGACAQVCVPICIAPTPWQACIADPNHVIMESYPRQCRIPDGRTVVEPI